MDAEQWAAKIVQVQSGLLTATEAARQLGVSRKSYYKRENRALAGLMAGVREREGGRPGKVVDAERAALRERIATLEKEILVLQQTLRIREVLNGSAAKGSPPDERRTSRRKPHDEEAAAPAGDGKGGIPGQGRTGDRASWGNLGHVFSEPTVPDAAKPQSAGSGRDAPGVPTSPSVGAAEYGAEKKRARQDEWQ